MSLFARSPDVAVRSADTDFGNKECVRLTVASRCPIRRLTVGKYQCFVRIQGQHHQIVFGSSRYRDDAYSPTLCFSGSPTQLPRPLTGESAASHYIAASDCQIGLCFSIQDHIRVDQKLAIVSVTRKPSAATMSHCCASLIRDTSK